MTNKKTKFLYCPKCGKKTIVNEFYDCKQDKKIIRRCNVVCEHCSKMFIIFGVVKKTVVKKK